MTGQPLRSPASRAALLLLTLLTPTALPDVTLISQQARTGSGSFSSGPLGSTSNPTTYNVSNNFTDVSPDGLHLNIARSGSASAGRTAPVQMTSIGSWTISDFLVVFSVDEPTPFTVQSAGDYGRRAPGTNFPIEVYPLLATLKAQDGTLIFPQIPVLGSAQTLTGILQPGTYTFGGSVGNEVTLASVPPPNSPAYTASGSFTAELTVGVPEPAALLPLFAGLFLSSLRRR